MRMIHGATAVCVALSLVTPSLARADGGHARSALVGSAPVAPGPGAVAVNPVTQTVYVSSGWNPNGPNLGGKTISVIDARRCNARDVERCGGPWPTITVGDLPAAIAVDVATNTVYVANSGDQSISVVDGSSCNARMRTGCGQTPPRVAVGASPTGVGIDAISHTVYVTNFDEDTVSMIDNTTCNARNLTGCPTAAPTVAVGDGPGDVDVNPRTNTVYVSTLTGMSVFDDRTCNATQQAGCDAVGAAAIPPCDDGSGPSCGPFAAKVDPATNTIYVSGGTTTVWVFDGRACNASRLTSCAGAAPGAVTPYRQPGFETTMSVVVDSELRSVYVTYHKNDVLLVIDADRCNGSRLAGCATLHVRQIHTGTNPESIALDPTTHTLYTADQLDDSVSVIDAERCSAKVSSGCRKRVPEVHIPGVPETASPGAIAADPGVATAYVTGPTGLSMIDTRRCNGWISTGCRATPPTLRTADYPSTVAVDPSTHTVYVGDRVTGTIAVLDDRSCNATDQRGCTRMSRLTVPDGAPVSIAVNARTHTMYVGTAEAGGGSLISVFDTATCNAVRRNGCAQTPARIAVADGDGTQAAIELAVNRVTSTLYAARTTLGVPFRGELVYVIDAAACNATRTSGCGRTPATVSLGTTFFGDPTPLGIAVVEATNTVYTANLSDGEGPGTVSVINGTNCNGRDTRGCGQPPLRAPAGFGTVAITADQQTRQVYTANIEDASVTTIDGNVCRGRQTDGCKWTVTDAIVGDYPRAIAVDPVLDTGYVATLEGVSVVRVGR